MRNRVVFTLAAALAACSPSPQSSSETHFLACKVDADCTVLGTRYVCIEDLCTVGPDLTHTAPLVTPGVCTGKGLGCADPLTAPPFVPGPEVQCTESGPVAATVKWTAELGEVDCAVGKCAASNPVVAVAPDGTAWVAVDLLPPPPAPSYVPAGRALFRFDAQGRRTLITAVTLQGSGLIPYANSTQSQIWADEQGHARVFTSSKGAAGWEVAEYAPDGHLVRIRHIVDGSSGASAAFLRDGSVVVAYQHPAIVDGGGALTTVAGSPTFVTRIWPLPSPASRIRRCGSGTGRVTS